MEWKKFLGFLSLALLVFAFMVGVQTESGYCLGDNILRSIGLKAWSLESAQQLAHGFHYTFLLFLGLAILGYMGAKRFLIRIVVGSLMFTRQAEKRIFPYWGKEACILY